MGGVGSGRGAPFHKSLIDSAQLSHLCRPQVLWELQFIIKRFGVFQVLWVKDLRSEGLTSPSLGGSVESIHPPLDLRPEMGCPGETLRYPFPSSHSAQGQPIVTHITQT